MKRILIANPFERAEEFEQEEYIELLEDKLPDLGFSVEVLDFSVVSDLPALFHQRTYHKRLLKLAEDCDIIYASDPLDVGPSAVQVAKKTSKPLVLRVGSDRAWERGVLQYGIDTPPDIFSVPATNLPGAVRKMRDIQREVAESADKIIVPSQYLKNTVTDWGTDPGKIEIINDSFSPHNFGSLTLADKNSSDLLIVSAGPLLPWKGFPLLIEVVFDLLTVYPNIKLYIYGDGPERQTLENLIEKYNLSSHIFVQTEVSREEMIKHIHYADMFVLNSRYEGFSNIILEALAVGTPTIATEVGGNREIIKDGVNGLLIPYNDKIALKGAISMLADKVEVRKELSRSASASVENFSEKEILTRLVGVLNQL